VAALTVQTNGTQPSYPTKAAVIAAEPALFSF
jgi:hypothetical protein